MLQRLKKIVSGGLVLAAAVAAAGLSRSLALRPDRQFERLLAGPSALDRLAEGQADGPRTPGEEAKPPLVVQAEALALYLNPPAGAEPPKRTPPPPRARAAQPEVRPAAVTAQFRLVGISYHRSEPAESKALVCEPDGSQRWVLAGAKVGHLTIRQVNPGSIVYQDGGGTHEMTLESEAAPLLPVRRAPQPRPLPMGNPSEAAVVAHGQTFADDGPDVPVRAAKVENVHAEESPVFANDAPEDEPAPSPPAPGRRARPTRPVARKE